MNPLTNVKNTQKLNERELELGLTGSKSSWHNDFKDSAWIFVGGLPYDLSEGDIICVFSQYGEIVNINLVRDNKSGKSKGFCFICYEDQRSTILAVDNLNSIQLLRRTLRVNHVADYKMPKEHDDEDEVTTKLRMEGCAPSLEGSSSEQQQEQEEEELVPINKPKKAKKAKKDKKKKKKSKKKPDSSSGSDSSSDDSSLDSKHAKVKVKQEPEDIDKYSHPPHTERTDRYRDDSRERSDSQSDSHSRSRKTAERHKEARDSQLYHSSQDNSRYISKDDDDERYTRDKPAHHNRYKDERTERKYDIRPLKHERGTRNDDQPRLKHEEDRSYQRECRDHDGKSPERQSYDRDGDRRADSNRHGDRSRSPLDHHSGSRTSSSHDRERRDYDRRSNKHYSPENTRARDHERTRSTEHRLKREGSNAEDRHRHRERSREKMKIVVEIHK